jgi:hypothetical protein
LQPRIPRKKTSENSWGKSSIEKKEARTHTHTHTHKQTNQHLHKESKEKGVLNYVSKKKRW